MGSLDNTSSGKNGIYGMDWLDAIHRWRNDSKFFPITSFPGVLLRRVSPWSSFLSKYLDAAPYSVIIKTICHGHGSNYALAGVEQVQLDFCLRKNLMILIPHTTTVIHANDL